MTDKPVRALGLTSGGLDSILSALILREQGIAVEWVAFETPFFSSEAAVRAARRHQIPIRVEDITGIYMEMLKNPPAGYGKNMNPCMDCHALMFAQAGRIMEAQGADFLFSGEVAGQRPKSQTKNAMNYVAKHSGFKGHILRPLSAQLFPETPMETAGLVDRSRLPGLSGRSRKPQMELAEKMGVTEYPTPAGGCLLTDRGFSNRLRDLLFVQKSEAVRALHLLKHGRHIRLDHATRIIVGRTRQDNRDIYRYFNAKQDIQIRHAEMPGPLVIMPGGGSPEMVRLAACICAGYTKSDPGRPAQVSVRRGKSEEIVTVPVIQAKELKEKGWIQFI